MCLTILTLVKSKLIVLRLKLRKSSVDRSVKQIHTFYVEINYQIRPTNSFILCIFLITTLRRRTYNFEIPSTKELLYVYTIIS